MFFAIKRRMLGAWCAAAAVVLGAVAWCCMSSVTLLLGVAVAVAVSASVCASVTVTIAITIVVPFPPLVLTVNVAHH